MASVGWRSGKRKAATKAEVRMKANAAVFEQDSDGDECIVLASVSDDESSDVAAHMSKKRRMVEDSSDDEMARALEAVVSASAGASSSTGDAIQVLARAESTSTALSAFVHAADLLRPHVETFTSFAQSVAPLRSALKTTEDSLKSTTAHATELQKNLDDSRATLTKTSDALVAAQKEIATLKAAPRAQAQTTATPSWLQMLVKPIRDEFERRVKTALVAHKRMLARHKKEVERVTAMHNAAMAAHNANAITSAAPAPVWCFEYYDGSWHDIHAQNVVAELTKLFHATGAPTTVQYSAGSNQYDATLMSTAGPPVQYLEDEIKAKSSTLGQAVRIEQTNTSHSAHTVRQLVAYMAQPPAQPAGGAPTLTLPDEPIECKYYVAKTVLYGTPYSLDIALVQKIHDDIDANDNKAHTEKGTAFGADIAATARMWSEYASKFSYDSASSVGWFNTADLKRWCKDVIDRQLTQVRICMNGAHKPDELLADPHCYNINFARGGCRKGVALYVSNSDHIPQDFSTQMSYKNGTGFLGLLAIGRSDKMAIESYKLNATTTPPAIRSDLSLTDAFGVHDLNRWLPLGLAVVA